MFVTLNGRKQIISLLVLLFLSGAAGTSTASCDIEQVCGQVGKAKNKNKTLTDDAKEDIEEHCNDEMHKTNCPLDEVIQACWEGGETEANDRCS
jgi:hypothetical protein